SEDTTFKYIQSILKKLAIAVDGSEVEENYSWFKFQLLYMDYVITQDKHSVPFLETTFNKIKNKLSLEVFQMAQVYNSFGSADHIRKAIKVIEDFGEDKNEILSLFNSYNHLHLKKTAESVNNFKNYLNLHFTIDERVFYNLIQYLNFLQKHSTDAADDIKSVVSAKTFDPPALKYLFEILTTYCNEPLKTDEALLERIKNEIDSNSETLRFYVGMAFYVNKKPNEAVAYLHDKIDKTKASNELKLYCQSLFEGDGDKLELLSILEGWRKTQPLDYGLIRAELQIREVQRRWDIFVEIAKQTLSTFPNDEFLIYALFYGFDNSFDTEGIKNNLTLIENRDFKNECYGIAIAGILLKAGLADEAIELLYRTASKKTNVQARSSYMASLINYPQGVFKDFPSVEVGTYVEYERDRNSDILLMDEENTQTALGKALLNKTAGEFAIVGNTTISGKQITVRVLRIMNKYAALLREIFKEAENPLSGHPVEVIEFEGSDVDSINKSMIENFGAIGSLQKEFKEKEFEKYYNGTSSFTEIASSVFNKNRFDAYFHLTSPIGKRFMAISPSISNKQLLNDESKFVLDVTSVCLFYQLSKELGLAFKHKFIISASLRRELVGMITETRMNPEAKLSINITTEGVTPHFYQEGFKEGRLEFLEEILQWLDDNCEIAQVDEKLNFVLNMKSKGQAIDNLLYEYIDNRLLVDRPNHFLLTNDTFYYRHLKAASTNVISPEIYLEIFQNEKTLECSALMLKDNYVGITIYFEILQEEFINMLSGKENKFPICLENFGYGWNPNLEHAKVIARFIKWLYLTNSYLTERKNQTIHTLFLSALRNAPPVFGLTLRDEIKREFSLLANQSLHVQMILLDALKIIYNSNK
ncbi:MAG: PIN domain-containing protein, partial [Bacteroidia bacterium]